MLGAFEALIKPPPAAASGTGATRPFATTVSSSASAVAPVTTVTTGDHAVIPEIGCIVSWISDTTEPASSTRTTRDVERLVCTSRR